MLTRAVDPSGYLPTYRPSFLLTVCAGYSGSDVTLIVTSRIARERSEARRSLSCLTDGPSACAENTGKGGQGGRGYGELHIRAWVCERWRNASSLYAVYRVNTWLALVSSCVRGYVRVIGKVVLCAARKNHESGLEIAPRCIALSTTITRCIPNASRIGRP